ncbi:MAG TPA: type III pantothenate kinase [Ruminiclostridium sp.]|nr:type III pantothenate kinase [Ruminiclostridium sp.]
MVLTIDIGNTNIVLGEWEGDKLKFVSRIETDKSMTADSYAVRLKNILELYGVQYEKIEGSIVSSVVPQVTGSVVYAVGRLTGKKPLIVGPGIKTGLNIRIDNPAELGSDIVADAVAALSKYPKPIIIFDMGTATTISVIDVEGCFLGGAIFPGVRTGFDALSQNASLLPHIGLEAPRDVIGRNTDECMKSGAVFGTASMIDGISERIEERLGQKATIVATGGNSKDIIPYCRSKIVYDGNLLLEGLIRIYRRNMTV